MPPRLQCLNAVKQLCQQPSASAAAFSTSSRAQAERFSSPASLLAARSDPARSRTVAYTPAPQAQPRGSRLRRETPGNQYANEGLKKILSESGRRRAALRSGADNKFIQTTEELDKHKKGGDMNRMISRRYLTGEVYAPHDMSAIEQENWRVRKNPDRDVFDALNLNPLDEYKNFSMMSEYMTPMGRIKHSRETGLRPRNQRKIAKAIRRAIGIGMMPSVHRHPEILKREMRHFLDSTRSTSNMSR